MSSGRRAYEGQTSTYPSAQNVTASGLTLPYSQHQYDFSGRPYAPSREPSQSTQRTEATLASSTEYAASSATVTPTTHHAPVAPIPKEPQQIVPNPSNSHNAQRTAYYVSADTYKNSNSAQATPTAGQYALGGSTPLASSSRPQVSSTRQEQYVSYTATDPYGRSSTRDAPTQYASSRDAPSSSTTPYTSSRTPAPASRQDYSRGIPGSYEQSSRDDSYRRTESRDPRNPSAPYRQDYTSSSAYVQPSSSRQNSSSSRYPDPSRDQSERAARAERDRIREEQVAKAERERARDDHIRRKRAAERTQEEEQHRQELERAREGFKQRSSSFRPERDAMGHHVQAVPASGYSSAGGRDSDRERSDRRREEYRGYENNSDENRQAEKERKDSGGSTRPPVVARAYRRHGDLQVYTSGSDTEGSKRDRSGRDRGGATSSKYPPVASERYQGAYEAAAKSSGSPGTNHRSDGRKGHRGDESEESDRAPGRSRSQQPTKHSSRASLKPAESIMQAGQERLQQILQVPASAGPTQQSFITPVASPYTDPRYASAYQPSPDSRYVSSSRPSPNQQPMTDMPSQKHMATASPYTPYPYVAAPSAVPKSTSTRDKDEDHGRSNGTYHPPGSTAMPGSFTPSSQQYTPSSRPVDPREDRGRQPIRRVPVPAESSMLRTATSSAPQPSSSYPYAPNAASTSYSNASASTPLHTVKPSPPLGAFTPGALHIGTPQHTPSVAAATSFNLSGKAAVSTVQPRARRPSQGEHGNRGTVYLNDSEQEGFSSRNHPASSQTDARVTFSTPYGASTSTRDDPRSGANPSMPYRMQVQSSNRSREPAPSQTTSHQQPPARPPSRTPGPGQSARPKSILEDVNASGRQALANLLGRPAIPAPTSGPAGRTGPSAVSEPFPGRRSEERPPGERPPIVHRATASMDQTTSAFVTPAVASASRQVPAPMSAQPAQKVKPKRSGFFPSLSSGSKTYGDGAAQPNILEKAAAALTRMRTTSTGKHSGVPAPTRGVDPATSSTENLLKGGNKATSKTPTSGLGQKDVASRFPIVEDSQTSSSTPSSGKSSSRLYPVSSSFPSTGGIVAAPSVQPVKPSPPRSTPTQPPSPRQLQSKGNAQTTPSASGFPYSTSGPYRPATVQPSPNVSHQPSISNTYNQNTPYASMRPTMPDPSSSHAISAIAPVPIQSSPSAASARKPGYLPSSSTTANPLVSMPSSSRPAVDLSQQRQTPQAHGTPALGGAGRPSHSREPSIRAPSPTAPSISSVIRPPSAPPGAASQTSLADSRKKSSVFSRIFRPAKSASKEPKVANPLTRIVSDNTGGRRPTRESSKLQSKKPLPPRAAVSQPTRMPTSDSTTVPLKKATSPTPSMSYAAAARSNSSQSVHQITTPAVSPPVAAPNVPISSSSNNAGSRSVSTSSASRPEITRTVSSSVPQTSRRISAPMNFRKYETDTETAIKGDDDHRSRRPSMPTAVPIRTGDIPVAAPAPASTARKHVPTPPATLRIPNSVQFADKKSPIKNVLNMRFLTSSKKHRTISSASIEALDGTHHTLQTTPSNSTLSTAFAGPPSALMQRDQLAATQMWRADEDATIRARGSGPARRARPGVTFDLDEDPPEEEMENRAKLKSNSYRRRKNSNTEQ